MDLIQGLNHKFLSQFMSKGGSDPTWAKEDPIGGWTRSKLGQGRPDREVDPIQAGPSETRSGGGSDPDWAKGGLIGARIPGKAALIDEKLP